jgi:lipopolysaccharide export system permease protein
LDPARRPFYTHGYVVEAKQKLFSWYVAKYIAKDVVVTFIGGTSIFLLILLMFQAIRLSEFVVLHQVPLSAVGRLCYNLMLSFLPIAVPVSFLFSVLMGISRANSEGEILALQLGGLSLRQIYTPLGIFSLFVTAFCVYTSLYTVPRGNRAFELLIEKLGNEHVMAQLKPGVFLEGFFGLTIFAEHIVPVKNEMKRVFIYDEREENMPLSITAQAGLLKNNPTKGFYTLRLTNGTIHVDRKEAEGVQQKIDFEVYDINLNVVERADAGREWSPPSYNFEQLKQRLKETANDPPENRHVQVEIHRRFSLAFSCIVFATLGFFIGILSQRGVRSTAILLCIGVAVVYWLAYLAANALALSGWIMPWLGIWMPNVLFLGVAYLCYRKYSFR